MNQLEILDARHSNATLEIEYIRTNLYNIICDYIKYHNKYDEMCVYRARSNTYVHSI